MTGALALLNITLELWFEGDKIKLEPFFKNLNHNGANSSFRVRICYV